MTARADVDICNMAALYAGLNKRISSLDDGSALAQACKTVYDETRRKILSAFRWPHAIKRMELTPYSGDAFSTILTYAKGDLVQYGENVYRSLLDNNGPVPVTFPDGHRPDLSASAAWWFQVTRDGYAYASPLPDDVLNLISVWEKPTVSVFGQPPVFTFFQDTSGLTLRNPRSSGRIPFALENANDGSDMILLLSDVDTPVLKYVADVTNEAAFPSTFVEAMAWDLAGPIALGVRGDEDKAKFCNAKAKLAIGDAFISAMKDQQDDEEPISEFEAARTGLP